MDENIIESKKIPGITDIMSQASKGFVKVKDDTGKFNVILPITRTNSVLDKNGKTLETYIMEISSSIAGTKNDIGILYDDADYLNELYLNLQANTDSSFNMITEAINSMNTKLDQTITNQETLIKKIDELHVTVKSHLDDDILLNQE